MNYRTYDKTIPQPKTERVHDLIGLTEDEMTYINSILFHSTPSEKKWNDIRHNLYMATPQSHLLSKEEIT